MKTISPGFTLMEIMLYIALTSGLLVSIWTVVFTLMSAATQSADELYKQSDIEFAINKLHWAGVGAANIQTLGNSITFERPDLGINSPLLFSITPDNMLVLQEGASEALPLLPGYQVAQPPEASVFAFNNSLRILSVRIVVNNQLIERDITFP